MCQQPMIADIDAKRSKYKKSRDEKSGSRPTEKPREKGQYGNQMAYHEAINAIFSPFHSTPPNTWPTRSTHKASQSIAKGSPFDGTVCRRLRDYRYYTALAG